MPSERVSGGTALLEQFGLEDDGETQQIIGDGTMQICIVPDQSLAAESVEGDCCHQEHKT